jgi:hypothetical protein
MWQYLFLVVYLRGKDETEMDGLESYVCGRIDEDDTSWFPQMKACVLQSGEGDKSDLQNIQTQLLTMSAEQALVRNVSHAILSGCLLGVLPNIERLCDAQTLLAITATLDRMQLQMDRENVQVE